MFDNRRNFEEPYFWLTPEDLEKAERRVPIVSITHTLTSEQLAQVEEGGLIRTTLLNSNQLEQVDEALSFDLAFADISWEVSSQVYKYL